MPARILLIGHYGGSNTGDDAMLSALIDRSSPHAHISVLAKGEVSTFYTGARQITAIPMTHYRVLRAIKTADIVVLGGGTHFHDDYRGWRLWRHYRYLSRFVGVFCLARCLSKQVFMLGVGVGPIRNRITRIFVWCAGSLSNGISVRDRISAVELRRCGVRVPVVEAFDLAALKFFTASGPPDPEPPCLGLSLTDLPTCNDAFSRRQAVGLLTEGLRILLKRRPEVHVKLLLLRGGDRESDIAISRSVLEGLQEFQDRISWVAYDTDSEICFRAMQTCTALCAMRFHAALLGYLAGCRLLLLPYHRKLIDLADEIGLSRACAPDLNSLTSERLGESLLELLDPQNGLYRATLPVLTAHERSLRNLAFPGLGALESERPMHDA